MISQLEYAPHPLAKLIPPMTTEEFRELADDIGKYGLNEPIVLFEDKILDGLHRAKSCAKSGVPPRYIEFADLAPAIREAGPLRFVITKNLKRRHLTTSQKSAVAAKLVEQMALAEKNGAGISRSNERKIAGKRGRPAEGGEKTVVVAAALGVSPASVKRARKVLKESPKQFEKIAAGKLTVGKAAKDESASEKKKAALVAAYARVEKVCGKVLGNAARNKARLKTAKDLLAFVEQSDADMKQQAGLIEIGWPLKKARSYKAKNLTMNHTLADFANKAATSGFNLTVEIDGWRFTVARSKNAA
jgi:ParB-like chromosome segregation protein Spo0J